MPHNKLNLVGAKFGRLQVLKSIPCIGKKQLSWFLCICECGKYKKTTGYYLKSGEVRSCGCLQSESITKTNISRKKHSDGSKRTYISWNRMMDRCFNENSHAYHRYGGRGISVCFNWLHFSGFYEDMGDRPFGKSIERLDNNKGYYKENCIWAKMKKQCRNRECTIKVKYKGEQISLSKICAILDIKYQTAYARLRKGESIESVLNENKRSFFKDRNPRDRYLTFKGQTKRMKDWAFEKGIRVGTLSYRLKSGWTIEEALSVPITVYGKR